MSVTRPAPVRCVYVRIILNQIDSLAPDCDPQILHEMEPISDLTCLRRTLASSLCVQPASVSA